MRPERTTITRSQAAVRGRIGNENPHPAFPGFFFPAVVLDEPADLLGLWEILGFRFLPAVVFPGFWVFLSGGIGLADVLLSRKNFLKMLRAPVSDFLSMSSGVP